MTDGASRSVLIIDDDEDLTSLLEAIVESRPGYHVVGAFDDPSEGEAAAAMLRPAISVVGSHRETFQPIDLIARMRSVRRGEGCIVLLADLADPLTLLDALACGASTVLSSASGWSELMPALDLLVVHRSSAFEPAASAAS
jgi:DNA-binding NarL/FixJ family response regulator